MRTSQSKPTEFNNTVKDIRRSIERWNVLYPLDKWYRDKYSIRYNSEEHKQIEVLDIRFAFEEEVLYNKAIRESYRPKDKPYFPATGQWLKPQETEEGVLSKEEIDDIYDRVDLSKLDDDSDEIYLDE